jgi:hypothetical protein
VKLHLDEMPNIPIMAYNVFSIQSNRFWTGWPNADAAVCQPGHQLVERTVHLYPDHACRGLSSSLAARRLEGRRAVDFVLATELVGGGSDHGRKHCAAPHIGHLRLRDEEY